MSQTTFRVRMDSETKKEFDHFCAQVGMNASTAFNLFVHAVLREKRLPFEVTTETDPFYSESNEEIKVPLDVRLTPSQNMQKYWQGSKDSNTTKKDPLTKVNFGQVDKKQLQS